MLYDLRNYLYTTMLKYIIIEIKYQVFVLN